MKLTKTSELPLQGVSHNPEILKKVFIEKGNIPNLMMFGSAVFKPGQEVSEHFHESMIEVFYVTSGKAKFVIEGEEYVAEKGDCVTIEVGERHAQSNPFDEDMTWIYFGISTT